MKSEKMELREIKNGRLAMLAFVGFCSQAAVQVGPSSLFPALLTPRMLWLVCAPAITRGPRAPPGAFGALLGHRCRPQAQ